MIRLKFLIFVIAVSGGLLVRAVGAQMPVPPGTAGTGTVRAVLASTPLSSVADAPRYFKLVRVHLPAAQAVTYKGPVGFVLVLDGALEVKAPVAATALPRRIEVKAAPMSKQIAA